MKNIFYNFNVTPHIIKTHIKKDEIYQIDEKC